MCVPSWWQAVLCCPAALFPVFAGPSLAKPPSIGSPEQGLGDVWETGAETSASHSADEILVKLGPGEMHHLSVQAASG